MLSPRPALRLACLILAAVTIVSAVVAFDRERQVTAVAQALASPDDAPRQALLRDSATGSVAAVPPRAAAGLAALWLQRAGSATPAGPDRFALARAYQLIERAQAARPGAAANLVLRSQYALARHGRLTPSGRADYIASYAAAPFLTAEGFWRVAYAAQYWNDLPPATRDAAVEEAVWLAGLDGRFRDRLLAIAADSPVAVRMALRLPPPRA